MLKRLVIFIVLFSFFAGRTVAQHKYNIEYITTENGLPSDGIKALQLDEKMGFLWIATEAGLVRYNGQNFTTFNTDNFPHLHSNKMFPLSRKPDGQIFVISSGELLYVKDNILIPHIYSKEHTDKHGVNLINTYLKEGPPKGSNIGITDFDRFVPIDSTLCLIAQSDTLWEVKSGVNKKTPLCSLPPRTAIFKIDDNIFIRDSKEKFYIYEWSNKNIKKIALSNKRDILPTGKKHLFWEPGMKCPIVLEGTSAWTLHYEDGAITSELICDEIPQNFLVKYIQYYIANKTLFLGTASKGLIVIRKNYLSNVKKNKTEFDEPNAIYAQIPLPNGNILANTGDIIGPNKATIQNLPIDKEFNNNTFLTKDSILWYSRRDSLFIYDYFNHSRRFIKHVNGSANLVFATTGNQTYMANYQGVYSINKNGIDTVFSYKGIGDPFDMIELKQGILAIASSKGLFTYNINKKIIDTIQRTNAPSRSLRKYKNYLFIGTYGDGVYIYKDGIIKKIPLDNNNYLNYTHCFILDTSGYCWMSTNRGLFKASLNDMLTSFEKNIPYIYYHFFGRNEGMDITEMNGGCTPCGIIMKNHDISFPTMDGALWVKPSMPLILPDSNVFIDQIIVNGHKQFSQSTDSLVFNSQTHEISFNIGFSAICNKENIYLQYNLNSVSDKWEKIDVQHPVIRLSNLPYGIHTLYIRKLKGFGTNNYVVKKIIFEILPPWYMIWWGQAILVFTFLIIVAVISIMANRASLRRQRRLRNLLDKKTEEILKQNEKLEKNDRIKTRLISIISHDIITPLKFLHLTSKYLSERKSSLSENLQNETLEEVVNTSRELELLSTNILNWIKYQNEERRIVKEQINLHELVEQVFTMLKSLAHKNNTELINNVPTNLVVTQFVDPIRIIVYNLVVNAINFTLKGSITISCELIIDDIQLTVKDTGMGMSKSQVNNIKSDLMIISAANVNKRSGNGLGYLIIKDLLKMISGEFEIESKHNVGTTVFIIFPTEP